MATMTVQQEGTKFAVDKLLDEAALLHTKPL